MTVRTRFAPSPTGLLHIGGARTALFAWLYARRHQGQFVLRIEDTDRERSTEASVQAILQGMQWLGLEHDEGPIYQTQRLQRYQQLIDELLASGQAYKCYCSSERLEQLREQQLAAKQKPRYDGHCRQGVEAQDGPYVIRFRNPEQGSVLFNDLIRGPIEVENSELDDLIIVRSDGMPTYNFTVVVDDMDMGISQVIRGDDHINNTPRQLNILAALGGKAPEYAHVPMILGEDGKRLSKRHGAESVMQYAEQGYVPEALLNYLVRLGWSDGDEEIFSREQMIERFSLKAVNRAPAAFNQEKLLWLNQHYIKTLPMPRLQALVLPFLQQQGIETAQGAELSVLLSALRERVKTLVELAEACAVYYSASVTLDEKAAHKHLRPVVAEPLAHLIEGLQGVSDWQTEALASAFEQTLATFELKMPKLAQPVRVAVTGNTASPSIDITLALMGRERALSRLQTALDYVQQRAAQGSA